jgi:plastocyanin
MSRTWVDPGMDTLRAALVACMALFAACASANAPPVADSIREAETIGALSGTFRLIEEPTSVSAIGPVVILLEPVDSRRERNRPVQQFRLTSSADRFDPGFSIVAEGDFIVLVNEGSVSHRLFSAALGPEIQIPVSPKGSSDPQRIERTGELRFFCSLHPDENFSVLVTGDVFSAVVDADGRFYIAPIPDGSYRLSVWSRQTHVPIRTVQVAGPSVTETISFDANLVRR